MEQKINKLLNNNFSKIGQAIISDTKRFQYTYQKLA